MINILKQNVRREPLVTSIVHSSRLNDWFLEHQKLCQQHSSCFWGEENHCKPRETSHKWKVSVKLIYKILWVLNMKRKWIVNVNCITNVLKQWSHISNFQWFNYISDSFYFSEHLALHLTLMGAITCPMKSKSSCNSLNECHLASLCQHIMLRVLKTP